MRNVFITIGLLGIMVMGCTAKEKSGGAATNEGIAASNAWLEVVDAGRYGDSWERACAYFRNG